MKPAQPTPPFNHDDEVSDLVEVLSKTGRRLEELTAGEVDSVVDCDGRTFLLRGTQQQLGESETARQGAILNALPASIALLDNTGEIKTVNDSWRRFAVVNHMGCCPKNGIGLNYLEACDEARGDGASDARLASSGIRAVLNGDRKSFSLEYECNSPIENRWFLLTVTPLGGDCPSGAVVMHMNITALKHAESGLQAFAERLSLATVVAGVGVWEWALASNTLIWDSTMFSIYGFAPMVPMPYEMWAAAVHPEDLPLREEALRKVIDEKGEGTAEFRISMPDGSKKNISAAERVVLDRNAKVIRVVGVNVDVTGRRQIEESLRNSEAQMTHLAEHDYLTGLPNRMVLNDRIGRTIELARRNKHKAAVLFLDMDGFKHINDSLGHPTGDMLIQAIGRSLVECVRASDTVCRQGGDEFIVLLTEVEHPAGTAAAAKRMMKAIAGVHSVAGRELQISCSIGVSIYPDDGLDAETLIKSADLALYQAKENGQSSYQFFQPAMNVRAIERQFIEENLRRALLRHEFTLHYQPVVNLKTQAITGAEALIRWNHPTRGLISPGEFIPIAEDSGLILPIGSWVLEESCRQVRAWMDAGLPEMTVAINVSNRQLQSGNFAEKVLATLFNIGLDPKFLELEVTESLLMKRPDITASILHTLREKGVQVAIDDFGTGYSSLSYLTKLPLDTLKIDQSFIRRITTAPDETGIVAAIIGMGQNLKLRIIAEGVETIEELKFLQALGCDEAQGFLFSQAVTSDKFEALVLRQSASGTPWPGIPNLS